jgi:iron only hydrogenase large subunit-like protein
MPCYDKKLEAVRPDFKSGEQPIKEVDNVLATHELLDLFEKLNTNFAEVKAHERQQQE